MLVIKIKIYEDVHINHQNYMRSRNGDELIENCTIMSSIVFCLECYGGLKLFLMLFSISTIWMSCNFSIS